MEAWENFLKSLEPELGVEIVNKWLRPLKVVRFDAGNLFLEAQDHFQALWFEEHVRSKAHNRLLNNNHRKIKIHLSIANVAASNSKTKKNIHQSNGKRTQSDSKTFTPPPFELTFDQQNPHCTIEEFHVTESNVIPFKLICETIGYNPETKQNSSSIPKNAGFNPIYLYGRSGTGKTHLLMAAATALREKGINAIYTRAETFTDHVVSAIRAGEMSAFRETYRKTDVLIVDDVHVFSRKGATQEEFFHTFNTLHLAGKQIILSANCSPQELQLIEPRLISRFEWGIVLQLEPLSPTEVNEVLYKKASTMGYPLNPKVLQFLLESFPTGPKSIIRALEALILRTHLNSSNKLAGSTALTVSLAQHYLSDLIAEEEKLALTPQKIIQGVADHFGIRVEDLQGKSQARECVLPRQLSMHLCRFQLNLPFMKIGDIFTRDHSTVMSAIKRIQESLDKPDAEIVDAHFSILKKLDQH